MNIEQNKLLAPLATFKIGGPARYFVSVETIEDIKETVEFTRKNGLKIFILGGGSNLLISENGFGGLVIKIDIKIDIAETQFCTPDGRTELGGGEKIVFEVGAGKQMQELVLEMCQDGFGGLEWAGGLPGTFGGAIRGNAGCFGGEIKDNVLEVSAINLQNMEVRVFESKKCEFEYRNSFFKQHPDWLIVSAKIMLKMMPKSPKIYLWAFRFLGRKNKNELLKVMNEKIEYRKKFQPLEFPSAGSVFKNFPVEHATEKLKNLAKEKKVIKTDPFPVIPAAFIIDECKLKGKEIGGAKISEKHPNFIINFNNAKSQDVIDLINFVKDSVYKNFFIILEEEIQII